MLIQDIRDNALEFSANYNESDFIYDLLAVYGISKANITKMRQSKEPTLLRNKVYYQFTTNELESSLEVLESCPKTKKMKPRFLIVNNGTEISAKDTKTLETLNIAIEDFFEEYGFFLPWTGREKVQAYEEVEADQKAAQKMAKLFDLIRIDNPANDSLCIDTLNHFFTRLIFCYYAEDTGIIPKDSFTHHIENYTEYNGTNVEVELKAIFDTLNTANNKHLPNQLQVFPYVNGGLFSDDYAIPNFSSRTRRMLIECGKIDWKNINPDIFGSMFQGVMDEEVRHELGAHYTSVPNIMKVIDPLFMDDLREEFEKCKGSEKKLAKLQKRISQIKIFDPACGSGNFLIIAYKEMRKLEMQIIEQMSKDSSGSYLGCFSQLTVDHFYGIEISPFAVELAKLSLWLAEHQMNVAFKDKFAVVIPSIPLKNSAQITCANACRIDWEDVCPKGKEGDTYILGNPPYLGSSMQNKDQKKDKESIFNHIKGYKDLDYIACWFFMASKYITNVSPSRFAFVSTNSISQGEQVAIFWPIIFEFNLEIGFAHKDFKWTNNAVAKAGVTCVIIGLRKASNEPKFIFTKHKTKIKNISPYLMEGSNTTVKKRTSVLSSIPKMSYGSKIVDKGNLIFSTSEKEGLLVEYPEAQILFRKLIGSAEFINGKERWCLWIKDNHISLAHSIEPIAERLRKVAEFRSNSTEKSTREMAKSPHKYYFTAHKETNSIIIPRTSSERRDYIPIGFVSNKTIISDSAQVIFDATVFNFGLLTSNMHMVWVKAVGGRLESRLRYSSGCCYNTYPIPKLSNYETNEIEDLSYNILEARDMHPDKILAHLYDPEKMPQNLRDAHHELDLAVDRIYRKEPFKNDEERLAHLFKLYEKMTAEEGK